MKLFIILLCSANLALAQSITPVKKGEPSPHDGYVIDDKMEKKMRQVNEENKKNKELNIKMEQLGVLEESKVNLYKEQVSSLEKENSSLRTTNNLSIIVYFGLGVLATGLAAYGTMKALNK